MAKEIIPNFSYYKRKGIYYVRIWDEELKDYTPAKSTKTGDKENAAIEAYKMWKAGQLVKKDSDPLFIDELLKYWQERTGVCQAYRTDIVNRITKKAVPSKHLKNVRMSEIKHSHINRLKEDLIKTDTPAAVNNLIKNIKTFIRWANSLDYIQIDFTSKIPLVETKKGKRGFLEPEEMQALTSVEWHDIRTKAAVCLGMWAGMRWGEVRALQWGDIDFEKNTIDVKRNFVDDWDKDGNPIYKAPKAGSNRKWPYLVFPELKNVLLQLYNETPFNAPDDLVLVNVGNRSDKQYLLKQYKPLYYAHIQKNFHLMLEAAGIPIEEQKERKLSYHSLRHAFTSFMATTAPAAAVMGLTGHHNEKVYEGYRHNVKSASIDALKAANTEMNKFRKNPTGQDEKPGLIN